VARDYRKNSCIQGHHLQFNLLTFSPPANATCVNVKSQTLIV